MCFEHGATLGSVSLDDDLAQTVEQPPRRRTMRRVIAGIAIAVAEDASGAGQVEGDFVVRGRTKPPGSVDR